MDTINVKWRSKQLANNEEDIITRYNVGYSATELAAEFNVNVTVIYNVVTKNGYKKRSTRDARNSDRYNAKRNETIKIKFTAAEIADMKKLYEEGHGVYFLAKKYDVDPQVIPRLFKENNIHVRDWDEQQEFKDKTTELTLKTIIERYGGFAKIQEMQQSANMKNYGVRNLMQLPEIIERQQKSAKTIKTEIVDGKEIQYQGYELKAIKKLLESGYTIDDIQIGKSIVPHFKYNFKGKEHYYFPDIFIPKDNRLIEVKSTWTYEQFREQNLAKEQAAKELGYKFDFMILSDT